jgi:hypothetical protein
MIYFYIAFFLKAQIFKYLTLSLNISQSLLKYSKSTKVIQGKRNQFDMADKFLKSHFYEEPESAFWFSGKRKSKCILRS